MPQITINVFKQQNVSEYQRSTKKKVAKNNDINDFIDEQKHLDLAQGLTTQGNETEEEENIIGNSNIQNLIKEIKL